MNGNYSNVHPTLGSRVKEFKVDPRECFYLTESDAPTRDRKDICIALRWSFSSLYLPSSLGEAPSLMERVII